MSNPSKQIEEIIQSALMGSKKPAEEVTREIFEGYILIQRTETCDGEVEEDLLGVAVTAGSGPEFAVGSTTDNPNWLRNRAINLLAIADYVENRDAILAAKEAEAKAARDKRRDELASEFTAVNSYNGQLPYTQALINRIIDLESAA